jgi:glyoxylase-like metal-dependent hydrolase (beta-lactamase superfamily II)
MRIAPSLDRLGEDMVSCCLVEEAGEATPVDACSTFGNAATLDVPGGLCVIHTPGHTSGNTAVRAPALGIDHPHRARGSA